MLYCIVCSYVAVHIYRKLSTLFTNADEISEYFKLYFGYRSVLVLLAFSFSMLSRCWILWITVFRMFFWHVIVCGFSFHYLVCWYSVSGNAMMVHEFWVFVCKFVGKWFHSDSLWVFFFVCVCLFCIHIFSVEWLRSLNMIF